MASITRKAAMKRWPTRFTLVPKIYSWKTVFRLFSLFQLRQLPRIRESRKPTIGEVLSHQWAVKGPRTHKLPIFRADPLVAENGEVTRSMWEGGGAGASPVHLPITGGIDILPWVESVRSRIFLWNLKRFSCYHSKKHPLQFLIVSKSANKESFSLFTLVCKRT